MFLSPFHNGVSEKYLQKPSHEWYKNRLDTINLYLIKAIALSSLTPNVATALSFRAFIRSIFTAF